MEDIMINKLSLSSYHFEEKFVAIEDKINELIEVVKQHKIDFLTWSGLDRDELNELLGEEASKGEGEKFVEHYKNYCKKHDIPPNKTYCIDIKKEFSNPPQQEESRGECDCVDGYRKYFPRLKGYKCPHKPQLKEETFKEPLCKECGEWRGCHPMDKCRKYVEEESPKEDEIRKTLIEWMYKEDVYLSGRRKSEYYVEDLLNILNRTVVSKEKIKREIDNLVLDYEGEECEDKRIADIADGTLFQLEEKLGLEEL